MTRRLTALALALATGVLLSAPPPALAATTTASLAVSATVVASCAVTAAPTLAFGNYDGNQLDASTPLTVRCNGDTSFWLNIGYGVNGAAPDRFMNDAAANLLQYDLYRDAGRTVLWTDAAPVPAAPPGGYWVAATGGVDSTQNVYGRIRANQPLPPGAYSDTVTVTVVF